jgi:hypothetical protein
VGVRRRRCLLKFLEFLADVVEQVLGEAAGIVEGLLTLRGDEQMQFFILACLRSWSGWPGRVGGVRAATELDFGVGVGLDMFDVGPLGTNDFTNEVEMGGGRSHLLRINSEGQTLREQRTSLYPPQSL